MAKSSSPNPFNAAKRATTTATQSKGSIYVADTVLDSQGRELFAKPQVVAAMDTFVQGHQQAASAKTMMETSRPIIEAFATDRFTREWVTTRKLPENPKVTTQQGGGTAIGIAFVDKSIKLSDDEKTRLAALVGANNIDGCVETKEVFTLDPDVLDQEVTIQVKDAKGKVTPKTDTVMNHMAAALQETFKDHPDLLASLFTVKPVQQTAKGLIDRGLELAVGTNSGVQAAARLVEFIATIKTPVQLKPVGAA